MSRNFKFHNTEGIYFIRFDTVYWIDVFIRSKYKDILVNGLYTKGFKKVYFKKIISAIKDNIRESRREWILWLFQRAGAKNNQYNNLSSI